MEGIYSDPHYKNRITNKFTLLAANSSISFLDEIAIHTNEKWTPLAKSNEPFPCWNRISH